MGSLLPGWDTDRNVARKEFVEAEEADTYEPLGYFAKLEKARSLRHPDGATDAPFVASLPHAYSLQRNSMPLSSEVVGFAAPSLSRRSAEAHPELGRSARYSNSNVEPQQPPSLAQRTSFHHAHVTTDWSDELKSLGGHKVELQSEKQGAVKKDAWWSHMDAGALNARPDEPVDRTKTQPFVPQFSVAGQSLQYHVSG